MSARILPFAAYLGLLALGVALSWVATIVPELARFAKLVNLWLYPVKTAVVLGLLVYFWPRYVDLRGRVLAGAVEAMVVVSVGVGCLSRLGADGLVLGDPWGSNRVW